MHAPARHPRTAPSTESRLRVGTRLALTLGLGLLPLAGTACRNPCQTLCVEIYDFAREECDLNFTEAELDQCIANHRGGELDQGEKGTCRDGTGNVADEWDCDELEVYFTVQAGGDGGADGGDTGTSAQ